MPLPDSFWDSTDLPPKKRKSVFRGTVHLSMVQNCQGGHSEKFHRSGKREDLKRWFDEKCPLYVLMNYKMDGDGEIKSGVRPARAITDCCWVSDDVLLLEWRERYYWHVVADSPE